MALAYVWLQVPQVQGYALQVFALLVAGFLILKRIKGGQLWHVLPAHKSAELAILTFAFLLLIGATGNTASIFYPLAYLHIFFIVMTAHPITAIVSATGLMFFHYAIDPSPGMHTLQAILTLALMLGIFIFAKQQYDQGKSAKNKLALEEKELELVNDQERTLEDFTDQFLKPRLRQLSELSQEPEENAAMIASQIRLIESELEKVHSAVVADDNAQANLNKNPNDKITE